MSGRIKGGIKGSKMSMFIHGKGFPTPALASYVGKCLQKEHLRCGCLDLGSPGRNATRCPYLSCHVPLHKAGEAP